MVKLLIARHCQTEGNKQFVFQGTTDTPLTDTGVFQLGLLSHRLSTEKIDVIYTSPLPRTKKTAEALNAFHNVRVIEDKNLQEIFVGDIDGMNVMEIGEKYPHAAADWNDRPWIFHPQGGESMAEVYNRVRAAIEEIVKSNQGKTVLITSHGCAIRCMMCFLRGLPVERIGEIPLGANTALSVVNADDGGFEIELMMDISHLPKSMHSGRPFKLPVGKT